MQWGFIVAPSDGYIIPELHLAIHDTDKGLTIYHSNGNFPVCGVGQGNDPFLLFLFAGNGKHLLCHSVKFRSHIIRACALLQHGCGIRSQYIRGIETGGTFRFVDQ